MDKPYLHSLLMSNRPFLKALQEKAAARTLNIASDANLNVLIKILHLINLGEIKIHREHKDVIKNSLREQRLLRFQSKSFISKLLKAPRFDKLEELRKLTKLYPTLLHSLFNKKTT